MCLQNNTFNLYKNELADIVDSDLTVKHTVAEE